MKTQEIVEKIEARLNELGWSRWELARECCKLTRQNPPAGIIRIKHTKISRFMDSPSSLETCLEIILVLGGNINIDWS